MSSPAIPLAVLSTKQAWEYVGGRPNFEELQREAADILKPWRRTEAQGKTYYLVTTIDAALKATQISQALVR